MNEHMNEQKGKSGQNTRRDDRRAKALRENLKRRKAQVRGRTVAEKGKQQPQDSGKSDQQNGDSRGD